MKKKWGVERMKLKPCPFCGGTDIQIKDEEKWSYIWCGDCLMASWQLEACSVEDNVEAWNKRTIITKHDKYTFNGDWACTDHMAIVQNGENNQHIENNGTITMTFEKG